WVGESASCFFSSRRRHTRLVSDWSSDVCSSDLAEVGHRGVGIGEPCLGGGILRVESHRSLELFERLLPSAHRSLVEKVSSLHVRSEERRVGKERRYRGWGENYKKKKVRCTDEAR